MKAAEAINIDNDLSVEVIRKAIKYIRLAVYPPAYMASAGSTSDVATVKVRVSAPLWASDEAIRRFVISKVPWIHKHQRIFSSQYRPSQNQYSDQELHHFQGKGYLLRINEHNAPARVQIQSPTHIDLYIRPKSPLSQRHRALKEWYRAELKRVIPEIIERWEGIIGEKVLDWRVKRMKTRWGSCNTRQRRIWINLELAKLPLQYLEYVIVHEMIHLIEPYHNDRFWTILQRYIPYWRVLREDLRRVQIGTPL